jgi:1-acyl-sn-glycerol-3-phosphate acyltransferase
VIDVAAASRWLGRARALLSSDERALFLSLPRLGLTLLKYPRDRLRGLVEPDGSPDLDARDEALVELVADLLRAVGRHYFRLRVEGIENFPASGPVLLVGNHSGGLLPLEGLFTVQGIHQRFGGQRRVYGLVHEVLYHDDVMRGLARRLGMLRAGHDSARAAFGAGHAVLVYPGSDVDAFRPFTDRHRIELGGRKGFLRLALSTGVPIVPVVTTGTHEQLIVLSRGDWLSRVIGSHKLLRTEVLPLVFSLPWGVAPGFLPYLPLPAQTTVAFGAPVSWPDLDRQSADDPAALERCYRDVERTMQAMMDEQAAGRRFLRGKPPPSRSEGGRGEK